MVFLLCTQLWNQKDNIWHCRSKVASQSVLQVSNSSIKYVGVMPKHFIVILRVEEGVFWDKVTLPILYRRLSNVLADFRCICPFCSSCLHRSVLSEGMLLGDSLGFASLRAKSKPSVLFSYWYSWRNRYLLIASAIHFIVGFASRTRIKNFNSNAISGDSPLCLGKNQEETIVTHGY